MLPSLVVFPAPLPSPPPVSAVIMSHFKHSPASEATAVGWDGGHAGHPLDKSESQSEVLTIDHFSDEEQRALVRKADLRLILPMTFGFAVSGVCRRRRILPC